jgi:hypothetical protein
MDEMERIINREDLNFGWTVIEFLWSKEKTNNLNAILTPIGSSSHIGVISFGTRPG